MKTTILLISIILAQYSLIAASGVKIAFVKSDEICSVNSDGSNLKQLTNDGIPKNWPHWSPDGTRIAFVRRVDSSIALAELAVIDEQGGILRHAMFRPTVPAPISGMRFVEQIQWAGANRIVLGGSINPSTVEYVVVDLSTGKEIKDFLCDGFSLAISSDLLHMACKSYIPHGTQEEDRRESVEVDGKRVFPQKREQVKLLSNPVWNSDNLSVATLIERQSGEKQVTVWNNEKGITIYEFSGDLTPGATPFWDRGSLLLENGTNIVASDPRNNTLSIVFTDHPVQSPSRRRAAHRSLGAVIQRFDGREPDYWIRPQ